MSLKLTIASSLTPDDTSKLPRAEQAELVYAGRAIEALTHSGFDPHVIAIATYDVGSELVRRDGGSIRGR